MSNTPRVCPECGHEFKGNGWDGIDAHWRAKHGDTMAYEEAWPLISAGTYNPSTNRRWPDIQQALDQADRGELIDEEEMDRRVAQMLVGRPL